MDLCENTNSFSDPSSPLSSLIWQTGNQGSKRAHSALTALIGKNPLQGSVLKELFAHYVKVDD